jgi:CelD/BcsL family acetyltransferase involved in cellulose biosynthesis
MPPTQARCSPDLSLSQPQTATLSVHVAKCPQEVEDLRPVWQQWTNGLDTDIDYFLQNQRNDWTILHPYVISVWNDEIPLAMLVAHVKSRRASTIVSMVQIPGPRVRLLEIVPDGRLGPPSPEVTRLIVKQLSKALQGDADMLCFHRLPLESDLFQEIRQMPGVFVGKRVLHVFSYSRLALTTQPGRRSPALSGKIMREARRKASNLRRAYPGKVSFRCFSKPDELDAGLRKAETISLSAWQHSLGCGFTDTLPTLEGYWFFARSGWLRIYVLEVDDQPCAYLLGLLYKKTFYCQRTGYDFAFARYSVGSILTAWTFNSLAASGVHHADLGEGGQEHNRRLGCEEHDEGTVHVYAPTLRGLLLNVFFGTTQVCRVIGRRMQSGLRLGRIGRAWKELLIAMRRGPMVRV